MKRYRVVFETVILNFKILQGSVVT